MVPAERWAASPALRRTCARSLPAARFTRAARWLLDPARACCLYSSQPARQISAIMHNWSPAISMIHASLPPNFQPRISLRRVTHRLLRKEKPDECDPGTFEPTRRRRYGSCAGGGSPAESISRRTTPAGSATGSPCGGGYLSGPLPRTRDGPGGRERKRQDDGCPHAGPPL